MTVNTSPTNSRVKEPPKEVSTSQELRMLLDVQATLADARFKLGKTMKFLTLAAKIDDAVSATLVEIIGAEDRRNERT